MTDIPKIYTDGSCILIPGTTTTGGRGGWAFTVIENGEQWSCCGCEANTTNNRMELTAVIEALNFIQGNEYEIYTDSQLTMNCASGKWKRKANLDLWEKYDMNSKNVKIIWKWVKAHNGCVYNEFVDTLAKSEAYSL
jgi:ribonuclease HI